jgi:hypothetical protein
LKRCEPRLNPVSVQGELQANCWPVSSEQRVLVTVPVVDQLNVAAEPELERDVNRTVGAVGLGEDDVIVQLAVAFELPLLFDTVTLKVWLPTARPE